jgi:hypothetical protein
MRFTSQRDYNTILGLNKELVNKVVDTPVIIYKLKSDAVKVNIYGEGTSKTYYRGIQIPCLIDRDNQNPQAAAGIMDFIQKCTFAFLRQELQERSIYPETGDIIEFDSQYYEINNTNEIQLFAGQVNYTHQIMCETHLMRKTPLQLEKPLI